MKKIAVLFLIAAAAAFAACAYAADGKRLGALSPEEALAYMEKTENLLIVDVAAKR